MNTTTQMMRNRVHPKQLGVSLIEVLVAILILALGLLGMAALQSASLRNNQSANERSIAVIHTYSIIDAMRANAVTARNGGYNHAMNNCAPTTGTNQATRDIQIWLTRMQAELGPSACGNINCTLVGLCTIQIQWDDTRATGGQAAQIIETEVRL